MTLYINAADETADSLDVLVALKKAGINSLEERKALRADAVRLASHGFRTVPTITERTPKGVFLWMIELHSLGDMWHQDDRATECFDDKAKARILENERRKAWNICDEANVDIHALACMACDYMSSDEDYEEVMKATGLDRATIERMVKEANKQ